MIQENINEEYLHAMRLGQKECRERTARGLSPYPAVLDDILPDVASLNIQEIPVQDIPVERIIGMKSAGRVSAFSASFYPLLKANSEFGSKWMSLCEAHLSETGIRDPIDCYEYLGYFYVQEGNKRVSVLRYFGAAQIPCRIRRVLPRPSEDPRIKAYYEFIDFHKATGIYDLQFQRPGDYAKLLALLGKKPGEVWDDRERGGFTACYHYFKAALMGHTGQQEGVLPENALLLWLQVHSYEELRELSARELKDSLTKLKNDVKASTEESPSMKMVPEEDKKSLLEKVISSAPRHLNIAMIYQQDPESSWWTRGHEQGARQLEEELGDKVTVRHYYHADTTEETEKLLEEAVSDDAELVFTTSPILLNITLKAALKYPRVRFLNCSTGTHLSSVRSYYCRAYEGKFISGVIAGAMAGDDLIGYVGTYPTLGVPAAINAFALGVRMTNPRAKIFLEWNCVPGDPMQRFREKGVSVICQRDLPIMELKETAGERYGTFQIDGPGQDGTDAPEAVTPFCYPCWMWGKLYRTVVESILGGTWNSKKDPAEAINYWWGMDSGAIHVELMEQIPAGVRTLAGNLMDQLKDGTLDIFRQPLTDQEGNLRNDGTKSFSSLELLNMDWLCDTVEGRIPGYDELLPTAKPLVEELGVYRDSIPPRVETAGASGEGGEA